MTDRRRHQRPVRPKRRRTGNGRIVDSHGLVRLCNGCSIDSAREWHKLASGGWVCDRCWGQRSR